MKYLGIKNKIILTGILAISLASCKKQLDVNLDNPNGVASVTLTGKDVFPNALQVSSSNITNTFPFANEWMGYWARTTSYSPSGDQSLIERFNLGGSYSDGIWQTEYHNIYDYNFVIANSTPNSILPGASKVMKAMVFQNLVDIFGNVPYSQAADPNVSINPAYDNAQIIYKDLITLIDAGITSINASQSTGDDASDIMFHGDKAKWVHLANTIKLRILVRLIPNGDQAYAASQIASISGGFLGAGEDATLNPGYVDVVSKQSPFWNGYGFEPGGTARKSNNIFYVANQYMVDFLSATGDPRWGYIYDTTDGKISGNFLGDFSNAKAVSKLGTIGTGLLKSPSQQAVIMTASESYFLQAEAAFRASNNGLATNLLKMGIEESFRFLGVTGGTAAADAFYNASTDPRVHAGTNVLQAIIYQKWVALAEIDGLEVWSDWRKTNYPDRTNPSVASGVNKNEIPKRLLYPQSEYNLNAANANAQNQKPTDIYTKIFWAQ